uniref:Uncharacterized protein n=1 Tax=Knipowitschia caucasica TaxID=637954 RepID=A0AAV2MBH2_KNICA
MDHFETEQVHTNSREEVLLLSAQSPAECLTVDAQHHVQRCGITSVFMEEDEKGEGTDEVSGRQEHSAPVCSHNDPSLHSYLHLWELEWAEDLDRREDSRLHPSVTPIHPQ